MRYGRKDLAMQGFWRVGMDVVTDDEVPFRFFHRNRDGPHSKRKVTPGRQKTTLKNTSHLEHN